MTYEKFLILEQRYWRAFQDMISGWSSRGVIKSTLLRARFHTWLCRKNCFHYVQRMISEAQVRDGQLNPF